MSIREEALPWGTQRAGFCTTLMAKSRSHEKENIVYCFVAMNGGSDGILWEQKVCDLRNMG